MENLEFYRDFLAFEKEQSLFDLQDNQGTYIWDIIRFDIYINLMWNFEAKAPKKRAYLDTAKLFKKKLLSLLRYATDTRITENFFFLTSRNNRNGKLFDQNAIAVVESFDPSSSFILESYLAPEHDPLIAGSVYSFPQELFRRTYRGKSVFNYNLIIDQLTSRFGSSRFDEARLAGMVNNYYADLRFFTRLFNRHQVKRVFVTQNGIQKGIFAAAKALNIPTFEFQHGIVDGGHIAYNYPHVEFKKQQLQLPDVIFSLSPFWYKDLHMPGVSVRPLGNDYFSKPIASISESTKALTIVSADVFGLALTDFLLAALKNGSLEGRTVYFKLHPNQFVEKDYFLKVFKDYPQVQVISNEYAISDLLDRSEVILTIQSTAVYEALQAGRKVILLMESSYERHNDIFSNGNVYLLKHAEQLREALSQAIDPEQKVEFFSKFNTRVLQEFI